MESEYKAYFNNIVIADKGKAIKDTQIHDEVHEFLQKMKNIADNEIKADKSFATIYREEYEKLSKSAQKES